MCKVKTINIDGVDYAPVQRPDPSKFSIIRADSGLFFGVVETLEDRKAVVTNCRQIHYFKVNGLNYIDIATQGLLPESKLTSETSTITILDVRSVTPCVESAAKNIQGFKPWTPN